MKNIIIIAKKEWMGFFSNGIGYIFAGLLLTVSVWMYFSDLFVLGQADLGPFWSTMTFLFSVFVPAISMGLIADEKRNGNWEVILSMPVSEVEMVLGKFVGSALYLIFTVLLSLPTIITIFLLGKPEVGVVIGGMLGTIMLGLCYLAVGILASSLSNQAVVGFLVSTVFLIVNNLLGQEVLLSKLPTAIRGVAEYISLSWRNGKFASGLVEITDLVFYLSWIAVFLILTIIVLRGEKK